MNTPRIRSYGIVHGLAADTLPAFDGYSYLVTAENRLAEEGTKGWDGYGAERPNPVACP